MFERELRFYREVAPEVGVRVPVCYEAQETESGYRLVLEDLSAWAEGGDPVEVARALADLHRRWEGIAEARWPWLDRPGAAAGEIGALYERAWSVAVDRPDVSQTLREAGWRFVGKVEALEREEVSIGRRTLIHGDASLRNVRTSPKGQVAFVDWEDVRLACGAIDLTWLLVSSVEPRRWDEVAQAYGPDEAEMRAALPHAVTQGILSFCDYEPGSREACGWAARLDAAALCLK